jgi:hypothetical protein
MRPSRRFAVLQLTATVRLRKLRDVASSASFSLPAPAAKIAIAHAVVESLNTWTEFVRSYFLSCILRPMRVRGGRVAASAFSGATFNDAIGVAMSRHRPRTPLAASGRWPRRDEPPWHDPYVLLRSCADLGCSNLGQIQAALSLPTRVFTDLPVFRNFFAHRNHMTAASARSLASHYSIPSYRHPMEILTSLPAGRPEPLLVDWIDDILIVIEFLCE